MKLSNFFENFSNMQINKTTKIILLVLYASVMFSTIMSEINTLTFILLFVIVPVAIYFLVKTIFPKP